MSILDQPKELFMLSKFTCSYCDKFTLYRGHKLTDHNGKVISRLCKPCSIEDDAAWAQYHQEQEAEMQRETDADHLASLLADMCPEYGCYMLTYTGEKCDEHDTFCHHCGSDPCACVDDDPVQDDYDEQDYCDGCGNYGNGCVCAELASLARHNADPATRGSWWVA